MCRVPKKRNKLRALDDRETEQTIMRQRQLRHAELALVSSESFVEHLDEHQLFDELLAAAALDARKNDSQLQTNDDTYKQE